MSRKIQAATNAEIENAMGQTRNQTMKLSLLRRAILFSFASCSLTASPAFLRPKYEPTTTLAQLRKFWEVVPLR